MEDLSAEAELCPEEQHEGEWSEDVEHCAAVAASPDQEVVAAGGAEASAVQL